MNLKFSEASKTDSYFFKVCGHLANNWHCIALFLDRFFYIWHCHNVYKAATLVRTLHICGDNKQLHDHIWKCTFLICQKRKYTETNECKQCNLLYK